MVDVHKAPFPRPAVHRPHSRSLLAPSSDLRDRRSLARAMATLTAAGYARTCVHPASTSRARRSRCWQRRSPSCTSRRWPSRRTSRGDGPSAGRRSRSRSRWPVRRRLPLLPLLAGLAVIELDNTAFKGLAEAGAFPRRIRRRDLLGGPLGARLVASPAAARPAAAIPLAAIEPGQPVGFSDFAFFTSSSAARSSPAGSSGSPRARARAGRSLDRARDADGARRSPTSAPGSRASCTTSSRTRSA